MSYYIDIIDTLSPLVQIVPKSSSAKGIVLEWSGGDTKDEQTIIGSNLKFDMLTVNDDDMAFIDFFTGDEHRFLTQIKNSADNSILWQGYILPDLYSEPYKAVNFFVSFTASDGLGRLKGKYLPAEYYTREKSVIDIFCQILRLTGLDLELYFAPAIENYLEKSWTKIYIDSESFIDNKKQKDAYKIFETLLQDTLCVCYQADNRWYIEGMNMRQMRKVTYKNYDSVGNLLGTVVFDRTLKQITSLVTPNVTMIPPYNEITISHKKIAPEIPKTAAKESNDGWVVTTGGGNGIIDCSAWIGNGDYYAKAITPDYTVAIYNQFFFDNNSGPSYVQDDTKFISLRKKLFLSKNDKVKFTLDFKIIHPKTGNQGSVSTWSNCFKYEILFNAAVIYSNFGGLVEDREALIFNESGECKIQIEHIFPPASPDGLLDIRLYRPTGRVVDNGVLGIGLNEISVDVIDFVEEVTETDLINGDFTIDKELDLTYAEDKSGFSNGFRLEKLKEETAYYNEFEVYVLSHFVFDSKYYSVVLIEGANLIKENLYQVYHSGNPIQILDVIYNFGNGNEMVVETLLPITSGNFFVRKYATDDVLNDRSHWVQWTDAFYKIENNSYIKTVSNIYRRMFNIAHEKMDVTVKNAVKFNDMVQFHYVFMKDFVVLNCSWNLDENKSTLVLGRANYMDSNSNNSGGGGVIVVGNVPPIVVAGNDIYINETDTTASFLATAYDPDGFIASQIWTKITGDAGEVINMPNQLATTLSNLTGDNYTFQIEVTDNQGATAIDTINIIRIKNYVVSLELVDSIIYDLPFKVRTQLGKHLQKDIYQLVVTPQLPVNVILGIKGKWYIYARGGFAGSAKDTPHVTSATANYTFEKNGGSVESNQVISTSFQESQVRKMEVPLNFTYMTGDTILFNLLALREPNVKSDGTFKAKANVKLQTFTISSGIGNITGFPIEKEVKIFDLASTYTHLGYQFYEIPDV